MRFGNDLAEMWESQKAWHPWFAWRPVRLWTMDGTFGRIVWLETIERRRNPEPWMDCPNVWEHRLPQ